jgi:hypothetical protein
VLSALSASATGHANRSEFKHFRIKKRPTHAGTAAIIIQSSVALIALTISWASTCGLLDQGETPEGKRAP